MAQTQAEFDLALADMQTSIDALTANQAAVAAAVTVEAQQIADFIAAHPAVDTSGLATGRGMRNKIVNYKPRSRADISNPFRKIDHDELLKNARVVDLTDNYEIVRSDEKRLILKPVDLQKTFDRKNTK